MLSNRACVTYVALLSSLTLRKEDGASRPHKPHCLLCLTRNGRPIGPGTLLHRSMLMREVRFVEGKLDGVGKEPGGVGGNLDASESDSSATMYWKIGYTSGRITPWSECVS